jgi:hypothetical protein
MTDLSIQQALFEGESLRARSAAFTAAWESLALELIRGFGALPAEASGAEALFARPLGAAQVAIVRIKGPLFSPLPLRERGGGEGFFDRSAPRHREPLTPNPSPAGGEGNKRGPSAHFLTLPLDLYAHLHDPFAIADRFLPDWTARGSLPELAWPPEPLPKRTVAMLDDLLKHGDGPFLLGAAQALVDGCKIVLERSAPAEKQMRELWALLPASVRRGIWPATFVLRNDLHFDLLAMPALAEGGMPGYLSEDQARDYPDSRYERHLQLAVESGDQAALDHLLSRKSTSEMIKLALMIIAFCFGAGAIAKALTVLGVF